MLASRKFAYRACSFLPLCTLQPGETILKSDRHIGALEHHSHSIVLVFSLQAASPDTPSYYLIRRYLTFAVETASLNNINQNASDKYAISFHNLASGIDDYDNDARQSCTGGSNRFLFKRGP
jgi:hypothetical protein